MTRKPRMQAVKANAVLEWRQNKLICNGVCVARWWPTYPGSADPIRLHIGPDGQIYGRESPRKAMAQINRRFGLPPEFGNPEVPRKKVRR